MRLISLVISLGAIMWVLYQVAGGRGFRGYCSAGAFAIDGKGQERRTDGTRHRPAANERAGRDRPLNIQRRRVE